MYQNSYSRHNSKILLYSILFCCSVSISCKKFVTIAPPVTSLSADNIYTNDATAASVLTGVYAQLSGNLTFLYSLYPGLSGDEFILAYTSNNYKLFYQNSLN